MLLLMAEKKKPRGRPKGRKETHVIQARVEPSISEALDELIAATRRTKNAELVIALENHLRAAGLWPKQAEGGTS